MTRIVAFINDSALLLDGVKRNEHGTLKGGNVVNGGWTLRIKDGMASSGRSSWPVTSVVEVAVPANKRGDYNDIINWARGKK